MSQSNLSEIGLIGLAVMGQNLALNIADHGFPISVYNRTTSKTEAFVAENPNTPAPLKGTYTLEEFVKSIRRPRKIILLVQAGAPTDAVIQNLTPLLELGDIIIDGGNSLWTDTMRREEELRSRGLRFIGSGVSGGEEGARFGPSLMPGGNLAAYQEIEPIWKAIAAKVDAKTGKPLLSAKPGKPVQGGVPCTAYIGPNGAGHFVKMVHNGIEYGDMQLICEAYYILRHGLGLKVEEIADIFAAWNQAELDSFLIEITSHILQAKDSATAHPMVDVILDRAGQKGTGKWTVRAALDMGLSASTISEAVFARCMSAAKEERVAASKVFNSPSSAGHSWDKSRAKEWTDALRQSLYASKICSYAQGFALMAAASQQNEWNLKLGEIASIWRGGCIIRAQFLQRITEAFEQNAKLPNLMLNPYFKDALTQASAPWRNVVANAAQTGLAIPCMSASLAYFDSYRSSQLPSNLLQAQRDYFGAHTYQRVDRKLEESYHFDWTGSKKEELVS